MTAFIKQNGWKFVTREMVAVCMIGTSPRWHTQGRQYSRHLTLIHLISGIY